MLSIKCGSELETEVLAPPKPWFPTTSPLCKSLILQERSFRALNWLPNGADPPMEADPHGVPLMALL